MKNVKTVNVFLLVNVPAILTALQENTVMGVSVRPVFPMITKPAGIMIFTGMIPVVTVRTKLRNVQMPMPVP